MPAGQPIPDLFGYPDGANEKVDWPLEKGGAIAFDPVSQKQQNPADYKQTNSGSPHPEQGQDNSGKEDGDSQNVQKLVPSTVMFVMILD
jgi:hypothetical protein